MSGKEGRASARASQLAVSTEASPAEAIKHASVAIADAFAKMFALGGYALVALFIGAMAMAGGAPAHMQVFWSGFALVLATLAAVVYVALVKRRDLREKLRVNAGMADALQGIALRTTEATLRLQTLLLMNAQSVADTLVAATPVLKLFGAEDFANTTNLQANIVTMLDSAGEVVKKAQKAISASDPRPLEGFADDLQRLNTRVAEALKITRPTLATIRAGLTENVVKLQQGVGEFCDCVDVVTTRSRSYVDVLNAAAKKPVIRAAMEMAGLEKPFKEAERLEQALELMGTANGALANAVRGGGGVELTTAIDAIAQLRELIRPSSGNALAAN